MDSMLELYSISYRYHTMSGETHALEDISMQIGRGEFVSIVGPSGCGKSTLLSLISGLLVPSTGEIYYHNEKIEDNPIRPIGYMLQHDSLLEWRDIYHNCILGLEINHAMTKENLTYVNKLIDEYGLSQFKFKRPSELSGGMRQRAALIRTLVLRPGILLLDEPFSALDYQTRLMVSGDICQKIRYEGKTSILVTHDLSEAISLSDRVFVLSARPGRLTGVFDIHLTVDPADKLSARRAPEFQEYFTKIWEALYGTT